MAVLDVPAMRQRGMVGLTARAFTADATGAFAVSVELDAEPADHAPQPPQIYRREEARDGDRAELVEADAEAVFVCKPFV